MNNRESDYWTDLVCFWIIVISFMSHFNDRIFQQNLLPTLVLPRQKMLLSTPKTRQVTSHKNIFTWRQTMWVSKMDTKFDLQSRKTVLVPFYFGVNIVTNKLPPGPTLGATYSIVWSEGRNKFRPNITQRFTYLNTRRETVYEDCFLYFMWVEMR